MTKVAWISAETPDRHGGGGQRRQFHVVKALAARGFDIAVAAQAGPQDATSLEALCPVVRFTVSRSGRSDDLTEFLTQDFDAFVVSHHETLGVVGDTLSGRPWVLEFHNVISRWHDARGERLRAAAWRRRERRLAGGAPMVMVCSAEERTALVARRAARAALVVPHGIDPDEWPDERATWPRPPIVAFFASYTHPPNAIAARWLTAEVWPVIRDMCPDAELHLIGPGRVPDECMVEGVRVRGRVDDLAAAVGQASVAVVPMREGMGARVKFGEALVSGAAVVATRVGAEGFSADGLFVEADTSELFADACVSLLQDAESARALGDRGRAVALDRLTWTKAVAPLVSWLEAATT